MATAGKAPAAAMPPAPPPPPPVPMSGVNAPRKAIAPQLSETPKGADPQRELAQRQSAAMQKHAPNQQATLDANAREVAPTPKDAVPPAAEAASGSPPPKP